MQLYRGGAKIMGFLMEKSKKFIHLLFLTIILFFGVSSVYAADNDTIYVNINTGNDAWDGLNPIYDSNTNHGPKQNIKNAVATVNPGGTIYLANGEYYDDDNTAITIDKNMTITGESRSGTVINGDCSYMSTNFWIFNVNPGVTLTLQSLTLIKSTGQKIGWQTYGGAIYNHGTVIVNRCTFSGNDADLGGAIYNSGSLTCSNCFFTSNTAYYAGGAIYNNYDSYSSIVNCTLNGCSFNNNWVIYEGGAIANECFVSSGVVNCYVNGCSFNNNMADTGGAISNICNSNSGLINCIVDSSTFTSNTGNFNGGAIFNLRSNGVSQLTAHYSNFSWNKASSGTAIYNNGGSVDAESNYWGTNNPTNSWSSLIYGFPNPQRWLTQSPTTVFPPLPPITTDSNIQSSDPNAVNAVSIANSKTVQMQDTGFPIHFLIIAVLLMFGGLILPKIE